MHVATIAIMLLKRLRDFIIPILIAFFIGSGGGGPGLFFLIVIPVIFLVSAVYSLLYWWTYRYQIEEQELHVKQGIFIKKQRYIQRNRVQSFDMSAGILQRLFGLVKVEIETAGGGSEPEVSFIALKRNEANRVKRKLLAKHEETLETEMNDVETPGHEARKEAETDLQNTNGEWGAKEAIDASWKLGWKRLLFAGMTSGGVGLVLSAILALFSQIDVFLPEQFYESTIGFFLSSTISFLAILALLIALIAWGISILITIVKYGQFEIVKRGNELVISRGLIERKQLTLKVHRITTVRYVSGILRQPFNFTTIYVESKGGGSADEQQSTMLVPLVRKREAREVLAQFLPEFAIETEEKLLKLPLRALPRYLFRAVMPMLVITVPIAYWVPYGEWTLILIVLAAIVGWLRHKNGGVFVNETFMVMQWRLFSLNRAIIPKKRIQAADYVQSPLQRWRALSTFSVSILSSLSGKSFEIRDVGKHIGEELLTWYSKEEEKQFVGQEEQQNSP